METVETISALRKVVTAWRMSRQRIAFVPTMGNLHPGHMSLIERARGLAHRVVVSIYVNPLQFGLDEDFYAYPRTIDDDTVLLQQAGVDLLFVPDTAEMYPIGEEGSVKVEVPDLSSILCGAFRPGHFVGVATIVTKLLNMVQPDVAVFGEKDYQQLTIIRRLVADLHIPVEIFGAPTGREPDGLAWSSRNRYLTPDERKKAPALHRVLQTAEQALRAGESVALVERNAREALIAAGFDPDYVEVRELKDLRAPGPDSRNLVILAAARLGKARLLDNVQVRLG